jgi:hypothetical protein
VYAPKALLTARLFLGDRSLRALAWDAVRERGLIGRIGVGTVVSDLVKLGLLRRARAGDLDVGGDIAAELHGETLCFRTVLRGSDSATISLDPTDPAPVHRIVWDHSAVARRLALRGMGRVEFAFGLDGIAEFTVLEELLQKHREHVWKAIAGT